MVRVTSGVLNQSDFKRAHLASAVYTTCAAWVVERSWTLIVHKLGRPPRAGQTAGPGGLDGVVQLIAKPCCP